MEHLGEYGFVVRLRVPYETAVERVATALKAEGFGVLTEIDVRATLRQKLDVPFRKYAILGACNPPLAYRALQADLDVGLLLPCNVTPRAAGDRGRGTSTIATGDRRAGSSLRAVSHEHRSRTPMTDHAHTLTRRHRLRQIEGRSAGRA